MSSLYPQTQCRSDLLASHIPPPIPKRVHPRTSLQSPYSQRFERSTPKRNQCANEVSIPASTLEHYSIKRTHRYNECYLRNGDPIAWGYHQRRSSSRKCADPAVSAIHRTCAEELIGIIESLIGRLERLDLDDHIDWEALVCNFVCEYNALLNVIADPMRYAPAG